MTTHLEIGSPESVEGRTQSQLHTLPKLSKRRDDWRWYLLPSVEPISFYDHVHQADMVAAGGHCQGCFSLLQRRGRGTWSSYRVVQGTSRLAVIPLAISGFIRTNCTRAGLEKRLRE